MKRIINILAVAALCIGSIACSGEGSKEAQALKADMDASKTEAVAKSVAELYLQKSELEAADLAQLALAYNYLAQKELQGRNDATYLAEYIQKAVECYNLALKTDKSAAEKVFKENGKEGLNNDLQKLQQQLDDVKAAEQALMESINS